MRHLQTTVAAVIAACAYIGATGTSIASPPSNATPVKGTVTVNNPATSPVLVRNVDEAKIPFGYSTYISFGTFPVVGVTMPIPAGKRLVIETVSIDSVVAQSTTQKINARVQGCLAASTPSSCQDIWVIGTNVGKLIYATETMAHFGGTTQARAYADTADITVYREDTTGDHDMCTVTVSGYLVRP